ncbi:uncharacterized protein EV420DRAFT_1557065, partial [Desarmillaria tabescens]
MHRINGYPISITVPLQPNPALTSSHGTSHLHHDGKLPIDLKFIICMRISPRGLRGPEAIFAGSTFLEGYTLFVDIYIRTGVKAVNVDFDDCESAIWMTQIVISTRMMVIRVRWTSTLHRRRLRQNRHGQILSAKTFNERIRSRIQQAILYKTPR